MGNKDESLGSRRSCIRSTFATAHDTFGLRPHEVEKGVDIAESLIESGSAKNWGEACRGAAEVIKRGQA